jgi:predicted Zn-dependent peptidase
MEDAIYRVLFPNSSLKYPIIGTMGNIQSFKKSDLVEFKSKYYTPNRTAFVVSGNFNSERVLNSIKGNMQHIPKPKLQYDVSIPISKPGAQTSPKIVIIENSDASHTDINVVFRTESMYSRRLPVYDLIALVLSSGDTSRLFNLLRNKLGATYFVDASNIAFSYEGILTIHMGVNNSKVEEVINEVLREIHYLRELGITEWELKKAKHIKVTSFSLSLQSQEDIMSYYGLQEIHYGIDPVVKSADDIEYLENRTNIKSVISDYSSVTLDAINVAISDIFRSENLNIIIYGSAPKLLNINVHTLD